MLFLQHNDENCIHFVLLTGLKLYHLKFTHNIEMNMILLFVFDHLTAVL